MGKVLPSKAADTGSTPGTLGGPLSWSGIIRNKIPEVNPEYCQVYALYICKQTNKQTMLASYFEILFWTHGDGITRGAERLYGRVRLYVTGH